MPDAVRSGSPTEQVGQVLRSIRGAGSGDSGDIAHLVAQVEDYSVPESEIVEEIARLGPEASGSPPSRDAVDAATRAILALRMAFRRRDSVLVEQVLSPDGRFVVWTFRRPDGDFFVQTGAFRTPEGAPGAWCDRKSTGSYGTRDAVAEAAQLWKDGLWAPRADGAWTNEALRTAIVAYLETAASFEAQHRYQDEVPIAQVPAEMFYQWLDKVDPDFLGDFREPMYPPAEQAALRRFHAVWESVFRELPAELPHLDDVVATEAWKRLRRGAEEALAVFARPRRTGP